MTEKLDVDVITAAAIIRDTERSEPDGRDTEESVVIALFMDGASAWDILKLRRDYLKATRDVLYPPVDPQG
jgi:hypothetical protein